MIRPVTRLPRAAPDTSSGISFCASTLVRPATTFARIEETFVLGPELVERRIVASLRQSHVTPDVTFGIPIPLATPSKGTVIRLDSICVAGTPAALLGFDQQMELAQRVLHDRFARAAGTAISELGSRTRQDPTSRALLQLLGEAERTLYRLPLMSTTEAEQAMDQLFDEHGGFRTVPQEYRPWRASHELHSMAKLFARRYIVACRGTAPEAGQTSVVVSYNLQQQIHSAPLDFKSTLRSYLQAQKQTHSFHVPLAKATGSYYFDFEAPSGYYVHHVVPLQLFRRTNNKDSAFARYGYEHDQNANILAESVSTWTSRLGSGSSRSRLFLRGGDKLHEPILVGVRLFEIPPGAWIFVLATALLSLIIGSIFVAWEVIAEAGIPDAAAVLATLIVATPTLAALMVGRPTRRTLPLRPRAYFAAVSLLATSLCVWMLARAQENSRPRLPPWTMFESTTTLPEAIWLTWIVAVPALALVGFFLICLGAARATRSSTAVHAEALKLSQPISNRGITR